MKDKVGQTDSLIFTSNAKIHFLIAASIQGCRPLSKRMFGSESKATEFWTMQKKLILPKCMAKTIEKTYFKISSTQCLGIHLSNFFPA